MPGRIDELGNFTPSDVLFKNRDSVNYFRRQVQTEDEWGIFFSLNNGVLIVNVGRHVPGPTRFRGFKLVVKIYVFLYNCHIA